MFLRVCAIALLSCSSATLASTGVMPDEEDNSPALAAIFQMAQKEMPLPVLKVVTWPAGAGKRMIAIEMSTAGFVWAKRPVMNVMFQAKGETQDDLEQAVHAASAVAKNLIEAANRDAARKAEH